MMLITGKGSNQKMYWSRHSPMRKMRKINEWKQKEDKTDGKPICDGEPMSPWNLKFTNCQAPEIYNMAGPVI